MEPVWRIELFGGLRARRGDQVVTRFRTQKTGALLAYLAYYCQRTHPRPVLIELLWPERDVEQGRHSLSVALSSLRDQLEHAVTAPDLILVADRISVGLNADAIITDVAEFEAAIKAGAETGASERIVLLARAVELYQGELLRGYVENWILPEQQRLDELFFQAIRQLIALLEANGEFDRAIRYARQAVGIDPLREEAHHELMRLLAAAGYSSAALRQYRELERVLKAELDASPDAATRRLALEMREQLAAATADPTAPATATLSPAPPSIVPASRRLAPLPLPIRQLEPIGGAVPLESPFYVIRPTDEEFGAAIERQDSIVLVKGSRQVGKTSLLARGLQRARQAGALVVLSDLDLFHQVQLATPESLLIALAETLADQLELDVAPADAWDSRRGANASFRRYLRRHVLATISTPIVWGLDQVDRLFPFDYSGEVFALFRSWHNERVLDPAGPWAGFTLAMAYATEAHLFIDDLNQSPFNVGTRLALDDFTLEQVADLNQRYGSPLKDGEELARYHRLVGGHPYLVRRGLHEMAARGTGIDPFEARASGGEWIFGDQLRRMLALLAHDHDLCEAVRALLDGQPCPTPERFYRLRSAGVLIGDSPSDAKLRCQLYAAYLRQHLP